MKKDIIKLASALCCMAMTMLTSCSVEDIPVPVVDNGQWNLSADEMDTSVRPGDDFFMYCNGGYWNNTEVDESKLDFKSIFTSDIPDIIKQRMAALPFPTMEKLMADVAKADSTEIAVKLDAAVQRINAVKTCEEAWKLWGQLIKEGYSSSFGNVIFSLGGKICVALLAKGSDYAPVLDTPDKKSLQWQLLNNPEVLARVRPLGGSGARRVYDHDNWPMLTTIYTELGFNLDDVYSLDLTSLFAPEIKDETTKAYYEIQFDLETMKYYMADGLLADTILLDPTQRVKMVENLANKFLKYEKSYIYTNAYVTPEMKQRTLDYCTQLRETFRERIAANEWMSAASKQSATEKLDAMTFNIGCPDEWFAEGLPDISNEQTLFDDIMALRRADISLQRKLTGMETSKASWHVLIHNIDLTILNAFYTPNFNAMNIFPAWMSEPFYDPQQNDAHNYATLMVFGHEITHGFDTNGAKYNKIGDLEDIWASDVDRQEFDKRAQQLVDCYNGFEVMPWALPGVYADGAYTVAENIADLGGVLLAYDTYVRHLCETGFKGEQFDLQRQRFFLALAKLWQTKYSAKYALLRTNGDDAYPGYKDNHSLSRERINGMVMNTDAWYDLFSVKAGEKLYRAPKDRVRIW
ncbi:MAG: M13 family metallopeptidase [Prevotella sp.]|nr:M13 family metallopeptidase [Prevotella sp.]